MMWPPIGIIDIVSNPPATIVSTAPVRIRSAAIAIDCKPDEQKRLIVIALVSTGSPARMAAARATFIPCSASGIAHPMITSSISYTSSPGTRASASLITTLPISSGRVFRKVPFGALPTAVRTAETITASFISFSPMSKVQCPMSCYSKSNARNLDNSRASAHKQQQDDSFYAVQTLDLGHWTSFLRAYLSLTSPQVSLASSSFRRATEMPLVPSPKDTVLKRVSHDSSRHRSVCAPASHRSAHRDPRYTRHASSGESPASKLRAPHFPSPVCLCVAAAQRTHSLRGPTLLSSHPLSIDHHSSKSCHLPTGNQRCAPPQPKSLLSRAL